MALAPRLRQPRDLETLCLVPAMKSVQNLYRRLGEDFDKISDDLKAQAALLWKFCCRIILKKESEFGSAAIRLMSSLAYFGLVNSFDVGDLMQTAPVIMEFDDDGYPLPLAPNVPFDDDGYPEPVHDPFDDEDQGQANADNEKLEAWDILKECGLIEETRGGVSRIHSPLLMFAIRAQNISDENEIESIRFALEILDNVYVEAPGVLWLEFATSVWSFALHHDILTHEFREFGYKFCTETTGKDLDYDFAGRIPIAETAQKFRDLFSPLGVESILLLFYELNDMMSDFDSKKYSKTPDTVSAVTVLTRAQQFVQIYKSAQNTNTKALLPEHEFMNERLGDIGRYCFDLAYLPPITTGNTQPQQRDLILQGYELCKLSFNRCTDLFCNSRGERSEHILLKYLMTLDEREAEILEIVTKIREQIILGLPAKIFAWFNLDYINDLAEIFFDNCKFKIQKDEFRKSILEELVLILNCQKEFFKITLNQEVAETEFFILEKCAETLLYLTLCYKELEGFDESLVMSTTELSNQIMMKLLSTHDAAAKRTIQNEKWFLRIILKVIKIYIQTHSQIWSTPATFKRQIIFPKKMREIGLELLSTLTTTLEVLSKPDGFFDRNKDKLQVQCSRVCLALLKLEVESFLK